ncbi:MAG: hydroxymethylglutaryl-CoA lyase [Planctomycetota bacterium]|nr:hydroxymethylglutaryl-CoA lyase [Planctomycetota bacterium]
MSTDTVRIVEVGPRDGLQSRDTRLPTDQRIEWIRQLAAAGLREIEAGSFVREDLVPTMADSEVVFVEAQTLDLDVLWALIPNLRGFERASASGAKAFAYFSSSSETFSQKNAGCSIAESIVNFREIRQVAGKSPLRAYLSCCFGCPYEENVAVATVTELAQQLHAAGADEIVISDTTGIATPDSVTVLITALGSAIPIEQLSLHLHDTHGQALECASAGVEAGVRSFDGSAGGLGGCPFAPGAPGNVATEDLVTLFESRGFSTGIDLDQLIDSSLWLEGVIGEKLPASSLVDRRTDPPARDGS